MLFGDVASEAVALVEDGIASYVNCTGGGGGGGGADAGPGAGSSGVTVARDVTKGTTEAAANELLAAGHLSSFVPMLLLLLEPATFQSA